MGNTRQGTVPIVYYCMVFKQRDAFNLSIRHVFSCLVQPEYKMPSSCLTFATKGPTKTTIEEKVVVPFTCISQKHNTHELLAYFCQQRRATGRLDQTGF